MRYNKKREVVCQIARFITILRDIRFDASYIMKVIVDKSSEKDDSQRNNDDICRNK